MPELPEVETVRSGLSKLLPGETIKKVSHDWPKSFPNDDQQIKKFMLGSQISSVRRRAKVLLIDLNTSYSLVVHLKMTGQLVFRSNTFSFGAGHPSDSLVGNLPDKSTRVVIDFADGAKLFFNDQRKFGWMRLIPTVEISNIDFFKKLGPEPLEKDFTLKLFKNNLKRRPNSNIKSVILDQTIVAGIGNIYADESLWGAKIHPSTLASKLSDAKIKQLYQSIQEVLKLGIEKGGSTDKNYVDAEGKKGSYLKFAKVFRRQGLSCPRCGTTIIKIRVAGRGTHICPKEQRIVK
jgi:formamidopyrimidine-DNA glycosylase